MARPVRDPICKPRSPRRGPAVSPHVAKHAGASSTPSAPAAARGDAVAAESEQIAAAVDFDRFAAWPWSHSDSTSRMDGALDERPDHGVSEPTPRGALGAPLGGATARLRETIGDILKRSYGGLGLASDAAFAPVSGGRMA